MSGLLAGSYALLGGCSLVAVGTSTAFARYYEDKYDREKLATITTIVGISLCLAMAVLLPLDVRLVNSTTDNSTGLKRDWATPELVATLVTNVKVLYYVLYVLITLMSAMCVSSRGCLGNDFLTSGLLSLYLTRVVPFAYFYYEALDEDEVGQTYRDRAATALKYTAFTFSVAFLLTIVSLFVGLRGRDEKIDLGWFERLATMHGAERALVFVVGILVLCGQIIQIGYTAFGLSYLPISMIKGGGIPPQEVAEVERDLAMTREKIRAIEAKYPAGRRPRGRDSTQLQEFQRTERLLIRRQRIIEDSTTGFWSYILAFLRPMEVVLGFLGLALTLTIIFSLVLSLIDRLANTFCTSCGFLIDHQRIFNPINTVLVRTSRFFPVDLIFFGLVVLWFFLASASGIVRIGVRIVWVKLFEIRKSSTAPQGLLFTAFLLMLGLLAMQYSVTVLAPQYSAFGNQQFCNNTIIDILSNITKRDCSNGE